MSCLFFFISVVLLIGNNLRPHEILEMTFEITGNALHLKPSGQLENRERASSTHPKIPLVHVPPYNETPLNMYLFINTMNWSSETSYPTQGSKGDLHMFYFEIKLIPKSMKLSFTEPEEVSRLVG